MEHLLIVILHLQAFWDEQACGKRFISGLSSFGTRRRKVTAHAG
jgi:hypothetical protein